MFLPARQLQSAFIPDLVRRCSEFLLSLLPRALWHRKCFVGPVAFAAAAIAQPPLNENEDIDMLKWALIFAVISLIAGVLGFTGIAAGAAGIAKILFFIFLVIFVIFLVLAIFAGKKLL